MKERLRKLTASRLSQLGLPQLMARPFASQWIGTTRARNSQIGGKKSGILSPRINRNLFK
jgi:hypothetical protein